jgi:ATP-binding cassette, subfamily C (CFTR/MRP), member 1
MSDGVAVEFDTPLRLYDNHDGLFFALCERSGIRREDIVNAAAGDE